MEEVTMFGLGNSDNEQRLWNFLLLKVYMTDKEIEETLPIVVPIAGAIVLLAIIVAILFAIFG
jgi:hypothetical protein